MSTCQTLLVATSSEQPTICRFVAAYRLRPVLDRIVRTVGGRRAGDADAESAVDAVIDRISKTAKPFRAEHGDSSALAYLVTITRRVVLGLAARRRGLVSLSECTDVPADLVGLADNPATALHELLAYVRTEIATLLRAKHLAGYADAVLRRLDVLFECARAGGSVGDAVEDAGATTDAAARRARDVVYQQRRRARVLLGQLLGEIVDLSRLDAEDAKLIARACGVTSFPTHGVIGRESRSRRQR